MDKGSNMIMEIREMTLQNETIEWKESVPVIENINCLPDKRSTDVFQLHDKA